MSRILLRLLYIIKVFLFQIYQTILLTLFFPLIRDRYHHHRRHQVGTVVRFGPRPVHNAHLLFHRYLLYTLLRLFYTLRATRTTHVSGTFISLVSKRDTFVVCIRPITPWALASAGFFFSSASWTRPGSRCRSRKKSPG